MAVTGTAWPSCVCRTTSSPNWGDPDGEDAAKAKPLPAGVSPKLPAEFSRPLDQVGKTAGFAKLADVDGWAPRTGFADGFPVAANPKAGKAWLAHCYGMVGAGRSDAVDSSNGTELYVVIGQAPRGLDLNITLVGRVLKGMEFLSALPRGTAAMGFYDKPEQRTGIQRPAPAGRCARWPSGRRFRCSRPSRTPGPSCWTHDATAAAGLSTARATSTSAAPRCQRARRLNHPARAPFGT